MEKLLRDSGHLIRPAIVLLAALGLFMVIRSAVVPKAFGQYGHYRPGALAAIRQHPISYAGQGTCVLCHEEEGKVRASGKHAHVACETCHGPLAKHADDPAANVSKLPTVATLCARCHERARRSPRHFRRWSPLSTPAAWPVMTATSCTIRTSEGQERPMEITRRDMLSVGGKLLMIASVGATFEQITGAEPPPDTYRMADHWVGHDYRYR